MFRLFLRKKVLSGDKSEKGESARSGRARRGGAAEQRAAEPSSDAPQRRNRRVFARHNIDHKHLTLMNEADILLVREISPKGFSVEVSPRGYERMTIGDVYDARIRYIGEIYDLQAKVIWKLDGFIGLEIIKAVRETLTFIKRLLKPIEIASSLQPVEATFTNDSQTGKTWFHGDEDSDLYVWHNPDTNDLTAWQLAVGDSYIEWNESRGLSTGSLAQVQGREMLMGANLQGLTHRQDNQLDPQKKQFAVDIIMALQFPVREEILETFAG